MIQDNDDLVIVMEGANDANTCLNVSGVRDNLRSMVLYSNERGKRAILATITPNLDQTTPPGCSSSPAVRVQAINELIRALDNDGTLDVVIVDVWAAIMANPGAYMSQDGLHPTQSGYNVIAGAFFNAIRNNFEQ